MPVPTLMTDLSAVAVSNSPAGTDSIGSSLDDYLRSIQAILRREQSQGAAIASATTTNIGATTDGSYLHVTGTTTISSFGTVAAGISRTLVFDGSLTLTHSSSLILPNAANITTEAGYVGVFRSEGGGIWRCVAFIGKNAINADTVDGYHVMTGNTWGKIPVVPLADGQMDIGRYIDFHGVSGDAADCTVRLDGGGAGSTTLNLSGAFVASGNVSAYSDARLKTDLVRIDDALYRVSGLAGYTFTRTDSGERQTGLLAQDVQKVLPEAVSEAENGTLSLAYGNLAGLLVEAIKELAVEVAAIKAKLA